MKDRKSPMMQGSMQVRPKVARSAPILNREIQTKIGQQLRAMYDDVVEQGVPDRFAELLRHMGQETEGAGAEGGDEDSR